jgi:tetratricopeptide (TPR) repeat protein
MGDIAGARVALASARVLDSRQPIAFQAAGVLALRDGDPTGAATAFSQALEANPADRFSREERARAYASLGDFDRALTDLDILLQDQPDDLADRSLRVGLYEARGQMDKALADADAAVALAPDRPQAHVLRGGTLALADRTSEAMAEFSRAIAISPTVEAYVTRARYRPDSDLAGKLADYRAAAALGLDADRARLLEAQAEAKGGAADQAVVDADLVVKARPTDVGVRLARATIYAQTHRPDLAAADFDWLRARPPATASDWNTLCWDEATLGVSLDLALADCDKAVAGAPQNPAHIDSRAFVLLRLGRLAEAIAAYDDALRLRPTQAASLYGRGVAETRAGDKARGQADLAAARAQEPSIDKTFAGYGVTP